MKLIINISYFKHQNFAKRILPYKKESNKKYNCSKFGCIFFFILLRSPVEYELFILITLKYKKKKFLCLKFVLLVKGKKVKK